MFREFLENNKKRRIASMFKKMLSRCFLLLAFFLIFPLSKANAGIFLGLGADTDNPALFGGIYAYWDLRDRESFFQVTNRGDADSIHIQIFNVADGCKEFNFFDSYTEGDTHVYDLRNLTKNDGGDPGAPDLTDGYGFIVATPVNFDAILIGNFRIIDNSGYEYRVNAAGLNSNVFFIEDLTTFSFNFNDIDDTAFSDVIGIPVILDTVLAVDPEATKGAFLEVDPTLFDTDENPTSCNSVIFACEEGSFNLGINQAIQNSRGAESICLGTLTNGYASLLPVGGNLDFFVGFIGLNNGDGTGSMDTWWMSTTFIE